ncbi:hypothetical protein FGO68_gene15723 [Halteria grandinella]|uniref:Uncharacterized protein n=1 Tax=Halteria grandinella TaxID=5974 RepID=A0A8J8NLB6_HALGN|nr:hypothetical protein FGO68_gene15723 [Halteria grandinella]
METRNRSGTNTGKSSVAKCFIKIVAIGDSGVDFSNKEIRTSSGSLVTLQIWDTAGQERYQSLGTAFYRGADCCLLCYDLTNQQSFENILMWKNNFLQKSMVTQPETFPFLVVGNKLDLEQEQRSVSYKNLERFCKENGNMLFVEASAKSNLNVEQAFHQLAEQALKRQESMQRSLDDQFKTTNGSNGGRSGSAPRGTQLNPSQRGGKKEKKGGCC